MLFHNNFVSYLMNKDVMSKDLINKELQDKVSQRKNEESGELKEIGLSISIPKEKKVKVLLIEPHPDDVILSMGASVLQFLEDAVDVTCLCIFSKGGQEESIRKKESHYIWKEQLGCSLVFGDLTDYAYRKLEGVTELRTYRKCAAVIQETISEIKPDYLIGPMGMGEHKDHFLVNQAMFEIEKKQENQMFYYEDFPYAARDKYYFMKAVSKGKNRMNLVPLYHPVTKHIEDKAKLNMVYQSQFQVEWNEILDMFIHYGKAITYEGIYMKHAVNSEDIYERFWFRQADNDNSAVLFPNGVYEKER